MNILTRNTKIQKTGKKNGVRLFDFSLPAQKTCPKAGECKKFCYGNKGAYKFKNVIAIQELKYALTKSPHFINRMVAEVVAKRAEYVRIHSSGDFYSREYFKNWIRIAELLPKTTFYAYTKQVKLVKEYILPDNFIVIFSLGGLEDKYIDTQKDRHSKIFKNDLELEYAGYVKANDDDLIATRELKIGLVKH
jgi:hypothetical protein